MITRFMISNFKAMTDFSIELSKFTCLIGLNDSGKSTLLHALDMTKHLLIGDIKNWFETRDWKPQDIKTQSSKKPNISFQIECPYKKHTLVWRGDFRITQFKCIFEEVYLKENGSETASKVFLKSDGNQITFPVNKNLAPMDKTLLSYNGSVLSILSESIEELKCLKNCIEGIHSFDMLSPQLLRHRAKTADGIGYGGENLSAFLSTLKSSQKESLLKKMQSFYGQISNLSSQALRSGWKKLSLHEHFNGNDEIRIDARYASDGLLRILAILAQVSEGGCSNQCLLFDEIENGINPAVMEKLMDFLFNAEQQIIVTTHNPMILNYLEDEAAQESVILMYRDAQGFIKSTPFFAIQENREQLDYLGPGEIYANNNLEECIQHILSEGDQK